MTDALQPHDAAMPESMDGYAYVARKPCGCIVGAIADQPSMRSDIQEALRAWLREDLTIDHVADEIVRTEFKGWNCPHEQSRLL